MNFQKSQEEELSLDMTPLIDMVFQLLIFFMVTTSFTTTGGIQVDLPQAQSKEVTHAQEDFVIAILKDGRMLYKGEVVSMERLKEIMQEVALRNSNALVIVQADTETQHGRVVQVMDIAKSLGLNKLAVATQN